MSRTYSSGDFMLFQGKFLYLLFENPGGYHFGLLNRSLLYNIINIIKSSLIMYQNTNMLVVVMRTLTLVGVL